MFGEDANWGRVLCAIGYAGADIDINKVDVSFKSRVRAGRCLRERRGHQLQRGEKPQRCCMKRKLPFWWSCNSGDAEAEAFGCDLTYDYVKINGDYRT